MSGKESKANQILLGAILGSIAVGASAAFLSSKKGQELKNNTVDKLSEMKDQLDDLLEAASKKTRSVKSEIGEKAEEYTKKFEDFAEQIQEHLESVGGADHKEKITAFLIGGALGGVLGAATASLLTGAPEKKEYLKSFGDLTVLTTILHDVLKTWEERKQSMEERKQSMSGSKASTADGVVDFVAAGLQLWQKFQNKT